MRFEIAFSMLINNNVFDETRDWRLLTAFVAHGRESFVKLLLNKDANIDATYDDGRTSLIAAVINEHQGIVKLLLERGANLEAKYDESTSLIEAACQINERIVTMLLNQDVEKDAKKQNEMYCITYCR